MWIVPAQDEEGGYCARTRPRALLQMLTSTSSLSTAPPARSRHPLPIPLTLRFTSPFSSRRRRRRRLRRQPIRWHGTIRHRSGGWIFLWTVRRRQRRRRGWRARAQRSWKGEKRSRGCALSTLLGDRGGGGEKERTTHRNVIYSPQLEADTLAFARSPRSPQANLDRFEAMLGGGHDEEGYADADEEQPTSSNSSTSSNLLVLRTLPHPYPSLFTAPLLSSLLALLDAYAPLVGWDPSPEEGTMRVVFDNRRDAERRVTDGDIEKVKQVLDGLELEVLGTEEQEEGHHKPHLSVELLPNSIDVASLLPRGLNHPSAPSTSSLSTSSAPAVRRSFAPSDLLQPPNTDRNFLISPPGSPPIGWEPIREDPPNRETLAGDLIEALMRLSGGGGGGGGRREDAEEEEKEERGQASSTKASSSSTNSPKPGGVKVVLQSDEQGGGPVVTVQSFDDDDDGQEAAGTTSRPDITQVKATVESMTGGSDDFGLAAGADGAGGGKRITPTGRPPLA